MASIPWWVYGLIGILVAAFAQVVKSTANAPGMSLFIYVGILLILIAAFKLLKGRGASKSTHKETISKDKNTHARVTGTHHVIVCSRCKARNYTTFNFCHGCGLRLRKL
ncbi:MAG: hypothetical protein ABIA93_06935 [Candidatus Woesearchaeota archaeon]